MDERRLRYFLAVVDEGGVTAAAAKLHVAQPSLSQALRRLEAEMGAELFHRAGRGLRLSAAGEALAGPARRVLRTMDEARNAVSGVVELRAGTLDVAVLPTLAVDPMAVLVGQFRARHPGVQVRVHEPDSVAEVGGLLRDGTCELGMAHLPVPGEDLRAHPLGEQELLFVLPPGTDEDRPLRPSRLARIPLVVGPPGTSTRSLLDRALEDVHVVPEIAVQTAAREAIVPLVLAGAGGALLPEPLAREAARRGAVVLPARPRISRPVGLVYRDGPLSAAARALLALAQPVTG